MTSLPSVSAIVPLFNGERTIGDALSSIFQQDYPELEVIVIDDGSTDASAAIVREFPSVHLIQQENAGVAAARNRGIAAARGDLLAFLDQDDRWLPGKLRRQVEHLVANPALDYVLAYQRLVLDPLAALPSWFVPSLVERDHPGVFPGTLVARRCAFDIVGPYDPATPPAESADWFARASDAGLAMEILPETLLEKRIHDRNQSLDIAAVRRGVLLAMKASIDRKRRRRAE